MHSQLINYSDGRSSTLLSNNTASYLHTPPPLSPEANSAGILLLPNELITAVFEAGQDCFISQGLDIGTLPFAVLASHVCRLWRDIALGTPSLWCRVKVASLPSGGLPLDLFRVCLARSKQSPLEVAVELKTHSRGTDPDDDILRCLDALVPHASRWRQLDLDLEYEEAFAAMVWRLRDVAAPMLQTLSVGVGDSVSAEHEEDDEELLTRAGVLAGGVPCLTQIRLSGIGLPWIALSSLSKVTVMELGSAREDHLPSPADFCNMLTESHCLRRLVLACAVVDFLSPADVPSTPVVVPSLRELICIQTSHACLELFAAPSLEALRLERLSLENTTAFSTALQDSSAYPRLESLALVHCRVNTQIALALIRSLPSLSYVSLELARTRADQILSSLLGLTKIHAISAQVEPPPWPSLRTLAAAGGASHGLLGDIVMARYEAALPLETLELPPRVLEALHRNQARSWWRAYVKLKAGQTEQEHPFEDMKLQNWEDPEVEAETEAEEGETDALLSDGEASGSDYGDGDVDDAWPSWRRG